MSNTSKNIGILGLGRLGHIYLDSLLKRARISPERLAVSHPRKEVLTQAKKAYGVSTFKNNADLIDACDTIFLCIKPQRIDEVMQPLSKKWRKNHLLISNLAGTAMAHIAQLCDGVPSVMRFMPNIAISEGKGVIVYCGHDRASHKVAQTWIKKLSGLGKFIEVEEAQMDAATGLSGSGPAFIFLIIEALIDAGVKMGLRRDQARDMAIWTCLGSADLARSTGHHPSVLKDWVTSPAGTAINGLHTLEKGGLRDALMNAVESATLRAKALRAR